MAGELTSISLAMGMGVVDGNVQPVLGNLSVSPSSATVGTAYTGTVSGKTAGSTLTLSGAGAAGLSVSGSSITGTPTASGAVNVIETLAGATGSPKTNAGVVTVAAAGPQAVVMPTPSFGSTNLLAWWDVTKTWKDSSGVDQPSVTYDTVGFDTVSSMEDLTGNGYGIQQGDKSLQPIKGAAGGPVFDAAGHVLECFRKALINGKSGLTFFAKLRPRSDLYAGGAARCILAISRASSTTLIRQTFELSSGSTGRRMFANINIADSTNAADSRATTSTTAPQLTDNAWNSSIWVENFSASPIVADFFNNSLISGYTDTGLVPATGSPPFAYGASDARLIQFGDTLATGRPAYAEMLAAGIIEGPVDSTRLAAIKTYLDGLA